MYDMIEPSFIPPPDIRQLRNLVQYRFKPIGMITGVKNRAQNCLNVSNLKLNDIDGLEKHLEEIKQENFVSLINIELPLIPSVQFPYFTKIR